MQIKRLKRNLKKESIIGLSKLCKKEFIFRYGTASLISPIIHGLGSNNINPLDDRYMFTLLKVAMNNKKGIVVDIGAHVGELLVNLFCVDKQRTYIGFEPNPSSYSYVQELISRNSFADASVFPIAISDRQFIGELNYSKKGDPTSSLLHKKTAGHRIKVFTESFDDMAHRVANEPIAFIKIDVEGAELDVLNGMKNVVKQDRPFIYCELTNPHDPEKSDALFKWLKELNYKTGRFMVSGKSCQIEWIDSFELHGCDNYFLCPVESQETSFEFFRNFVN